MKMSKIDFLALFHHIHHDEDGHEVHHCGKAHSKTNQKLDYEIKHCCCGKHCIDKKEAMGHDLEFKDVLVEFAEECLEGGWHIESGEIKNDSSQRRFISENKRP